MPYTSVDEVLPTRALFVCLSGRYGDRLDGAQKSLLPRSGWHATRLMSWTPHLRQFQARHV
jgi:hypothetical protein